MKLKYLHFRSALIIGMFLGLYTDSLQATEKSITDQSPVQLNLNHLKENIQEVSEKYFELFLTPFDKHLKNGQPSEAHKHAGIFMTEYKQRYDGTKIFAKSETAYFKYLERYGRIEDTERFHPFYFRRFNSSDLEKAMLSNKSSIDYVFNKKVEEVEKIKSAAKKRTPTRSEVLKDRDRIYEQTPQKWKEFLASIPEEKKAILELVQPICSILASASPESFTEALNIVSLSKLIMQKLDALKEYDLHSSLDNVNTWYFSELIELNRHLNSTGEEEIYYPHERETLNKFEKLQSDFNDKILLEDKKIAFIEKYPAFFDLSPLSRPLAIGAGSLGQEILRGDGVIVGVIDYYAYCKDSILLKQCVNPEYIYTSKEKNINRELSDMLYYFHKIKLQIA